MDDATLTDLLSGKHVNMEVRRERGIWPDDPLKFDDLVAHLARLVTARDWFPRQFELTHPKGWVPDVTMIERRDDGSCVVHVQRAGALGNAVAERFTRAFSTAESAASFYLRIELNLPGDLDGWEVVA